MAIATMLCLWFMALGLALGDRIYNVLDYQAGGNGISDDTSAFLKAWGDACADASNATLLIPKDKTFLLSQVTFQGPCKSGVHVQIDGNIVAPNKLWTAELTNFLQFMGIQSLTIDGNGEIDGRGPIWWDCFAKNGCKIRPNVIGILSCQDIKISGIKIRNSPGKHMVFFLSSWAHVSGATISAPGNSPNTDGIYVAGSQHVEITNNTIACGDDCITIGPGSMDINVSSIRCGPGHGISIGSLGGQSATVDQVHVSNCSIFETMTGVRIKTWLGSSGYAREITFENINFTAVQTPIVIDQYYCPHQSCRNWTELTAVEISNVQFVGLHGTSAQQKAIDIVCSKVVPCKGITVKDIGLYWEGHTEPTNSACENAFGASVGQVVPPVPCLE